MCEELISKYHEMYFDLVMLNVLKTYRFCALRQGEAYIDYAASMNWIQQFLDSLTEIPQKIHGPNADKLYFDKSPGLSLIHHLRVATMPRADPSETAAECEQVVWGFLFSTGEAREADLRRNFFEAAARRIAYETYSFDLMLDIEDHAKKRRL